MNENLHQHEAASQVQPPAAAASAPHLEQTASQAKTLLAAGADIISKTLSGNSEAFLQANVQHGGQ